MAQKNENLLADDDHYLQAKLGPKSSSLGALAWLSSFFLAVQFFN